VQETYAAELQAVPAREPQAQAAGGGPPSLFRQPAPQRERLPEATELAAFISGDEQTEAQRAEAAAKAQQRQQAELALINEACGGDFSTLDTGQKAGLALQLTFSRTFSGLGETNWPKFGKDLLRGFIDPRVSLAGVLTGLGMIASGGMNLFSAEQWARDPLGNLLKSSADIATGVTVVLGSIAGLAVAVIAISAALILLSWGFLAPVFLPVINRARQIMATYADMEELIRLGAYRAGSSAEVDEAISLHQPLEAFLGQGKEESTPLTEAYMRLTEIIARAETEN